jgi:hypothetical protein
MSIYDFDVLSDRHPPPPRPPAAAGVPPHGGAAPSLLREARVAADAARPPEPTGTR